VTPSRKLQCVWKSNAEHSWWMGDKIYTKTAPAS